MSDKILYVDDEPNVLAACKRSLGRKLKITTVTSGAEGLEIIRKDGPFAVVLSDMRMPEMDGIEFLCAVREQAPDTVCMMLTGNSDQETAMNAVNKGQVFRFLTKPCPQDILSTALENGIKQYRLITAEKELLQNTLLGSIKALSEVLSLVNPKAFARGNRIKPIVKALVAELDLDHAWQYEIAALLSQVGCIVLPPKIIDMVFSGEKLATKEAEMYASHPIHGSKFLNNIPRLEKCARMIDGQMKRFDAIETSGLDADEKAVVLGSQILHVALDFDLYLSDGFNRQAAVLKMNNKEGEYNPQLLKILTAISIPGIDGILMGTVKELEIWQLAVGMYAEKEILTSTGTLLVTKGAEITQPLIERLRNFAKGVGVQEPIKVFVPHEKIADAA